MTSLKQLKAQHEACLKATGRGAPARTINPFFGVGPITDITTDEADSRKMRYEFERWLEHTYRKYDDKGNDLGGFTAAEIGRSMHRGYPADAILRDMMREINRYFCFPRSNKYSNYGKATYIVSSNLFLFACSQAFHEIPGVSHIHPPVFGVNFSNNLSIPQVWVNMKKIEHDTTFEIS